MGILTSIINAILALWQILKLGKTVYDTVSEIQHRAKVERAANACLLYTSPSPRDRTRSRMPSSA